MKNDKLDEIKRRIATGWGAFGQYREIMKSNIPIRLKAKVYNQCIQAAMTYGCQTWAVTKNAGKVENNSKKHGESYDWCNKKRS